MFLGGAGNTSRLPLRRERAIDYYLTPVNRRPLLVKLSSAGWSRFSGAFLRLLDCCFRHEPGQRGLAVVNERDDGKIPDLSRLNHCLAQCPNDPVCHIEGSVATV